MGIPQHVHATGGAQLETSNSHPIHCCFLDTGIIEVLLLVILCLQVLRFYAVWDDRSGLYGDRRPYVVHYYLEDDTVEINEVRTLR
jgi:hypothetical protein